jgi:hypothetical protein
LLQIEVKFAALRDQLYVERMDELSREEEVIADGKPIVCLHCSLLDISLIMDSSPLLNRLPSVLVALASNLTRPTRKLAAPGRTAVEAK